MLNNFRLFFSISHLCYSEGIPYIQKLQQRLKKGDELSLFNFSSVFPQPSLAKRLFSSHQHSQIFELYLKFLESGEEKPEGISYCYIEEKLRCYALGVLRKRGERLRVQHFRPIETKLLEASTLRGVFIHRKYNLDTDSYEISTPQKKIVDFSIKKSLRAPVVGQSQRLAKLFSEEKMEEIYHKHYDQFLREGSIKRYLIRLEAELIITSYSKIGEQKRGGAGPTEHIIQVESVFNPVSNMEEFFLTDVDFVMEGNYYLRSALRA